MKRVCFLIIVAASLMVVACTAYAHGLGKQQLERVEVGPYRVTAWTDPFTARTDKELHVTVAVENAEGLVLDAEIVVTATYKEDRDQRERASGTHQQAANKLHYEARLNLERKGVWEINIAIDAPDGKGDVSFDLEVEAGKSSLPWGWMGVGIAGVAVVVMAIVNRLRLMRLKEGKQ